MAFPNEPTPALVKRVLNNLPLDIIVEWLQDTRGYTVLPPSHPLADDVAGTDFDKWMLLVDSVNDLDQLGTVADIRRAFNMLIDLLQPPSVREARAKA